MPLMVRFSATDYSEFGWDVDQTATVAQWVSDRGVDLIDVSSGGLIPGVTIPSGPGYQVPFAERVAAATSAAVGAVGQITTAVQAEEILQQGETDVIFVGRAFLRDPNWGLRAAQELGVEIDWVPQYKRGMWPKV
jgi:2,4-dienoyl-CoA reductase-like NADH-dependent reductase (Old Yellow Enzyme family)